MTEGLIKMYVVHSGELGNNYSIKLGNSVTGGGLIGNSSGMDGNGMVRIVSSS